MRFHRFKFIPLLLAATLLSPTLWPSPLHGEESPTAPPVQSSAAVAASASLNLLENAALLAQAAAVRERANHDFLAQARGFAHTEASLEQARKAFERTAAPESASTAALPASLEEADQLLTGLARRNERLTTRLTLLEQQGELLGRLMEQAEATGLSGRASLALLRQLQSIAFEARLRLRDGAMAGESPPGWLKENAVALAIAERERAVERWQARAEALIGEREELAGRLARIQQSITAAEESAKRIRIQRGKLQNEQEMEARFRGRPSERLDRRLSVLRFSADRLLVAFKRANSAFSQAREAVAPLQQALEGRPAPDLDSDPAALQSGGILERHALATESARLAGLGEVLEARRGALEALKNGLTEARQSGEAAAAKGATLRDLLRQIEILRKVLSSSESGAVQAESGDEAVVLRNTLETLHTEIRAVAEALDGVEAEAGRLQVSSEQLQAKRYRLQRLNQAMERIAWQAPEGLDPVGKEALLSRFQTAHAEVETLSQRLKEQEEALTAARARVAEATAARDAPGMGADPAAHRTLAEAQERFRRKLLDAARLEAISPAVDSASFMSGDLTIASEEAGGGSRVSPGEVSAAGALESGPEGVAPTGSAGPSASLTLAERMRPVIETHQGLLIGMRERIAGQREREQAAADARDGQLEASEAVLLTLQELARALNVRFALAERIQTQFSADELVDFERAEAVADTLRHDDRGSTQKALLNRYFIHETLKQRQELAGLAAATTEEELLAALEDLNGLGGRRAGALRMWEKIQAKIEQEADLRPETERQAIEQMAWRRLESEDSPMESLLSVFPSDRVETLDNLLHRFYVEALLLEERGGQLRDQERIVQELLEAIAEEEEATGTLLPILQARQGALRLRTEVELTFAQARLAPEQADALFRDLENRTGFVFTPAAFPGLQEAGKRALIDEALSVLRGLGAQQALIQEWIAALLPRGETLGENPERPHYQQAAGVIEAQLAENSRQINSLGSGPASAGGGALAPEGAGEPEGGGALGDLPPGEAGEIGRMRIQRLDALEQSGLTVGAKLAGIFLFAPVFFLTTRLYRRRAVKRIEASDLDAKEKDQRRLLVSFWYGTGRFAVWAGLILMVLSVLGFNVGALLAGLGIGGLAIAMALKSTLGDIIGGLNLLWTRFLKVGDIINFKGQWCWVREIGLRYTRLAVFGLEHAMLVPNAMLSEMEVSKVSAHPGLRVNASLTLAISTTPEQNAQAVEIIKKTLEENPDARLIFARHNGFKDQAYEIIFMYDVTKFENRNRVMTEIQLGLLTACQEAGIPFARTPVSVEMVPV